MEVDNIIVFKPRGDYYYVKLIYADHNDIYWLQDGKINKYVIEGKVIKYVIRSI